MKNGMLLLLATLKGHVFLIIVEIPSTEIDMIVGILTGYEALGMLVMSASNMRVEKLGLQGCSLS